MKFPIMLAHGIARFDFLANVILHLDNQDDPALDKKHYFKGIRTMLMAEGFTVSHSSVAFADSVEVRADQLLTDVTAFLNKTRSEKIHLIAHSMGGLDARHMMFNDRNAGRIHERIASLTTISTPHHGSPVADWAIQNLPVLGSLLKDLGVSIAGLRDCTTGACQRFNDDFEVADFEARLKVPILTYAGRSSLLTMVGILKPFFALIDSREGPNDGLVSVQSAKWRDQPHVEIWNNTDHLNELGWFDPAQLFTGETADELLTRIHAAYRRIAERVTRLGEDQTPEVDHMFHVLGFRSGAKKRLTVTHAPAAAGAVAVAAPAPDPEPAPITKLSQLESLEAAFQNNPAEVLSRARTLIDGDLTPEDLAKAIKDAKNAFQNPTITAQKALLQAPIPLPADFTFPGMNTAEIPIHPEETKFETKADALRWILFCGPFVLSAALSDKAPFRFHTSHASRFRYNMPDVDGLEVAVFADFGTGLYHSRYIAKQLKERQFALAFHLGDVYYSGRQSEFEDNFMPHLDPILAQTQLFTISGNHEMYSSDKPFFDYMDVRKASGQLQEGSYFSVANSRFQIVGIDTEYFDRARHKEPTLLAWLDETLTMARAANRKIILLSSDEPYEYGKNGTTGLFEDLQPILQNNPVDIWCWGNTHYCALFERGAGLPFVGACLGHGGYPYSTRSDGDIEPAPVAFLETASRFPKATNIRQDRGNNGYCGFRLFADGSIEMRFIDWMSNTRCVAQLSGNPLVITSVNEQPNP